MSFEKPDSDGSNLTKSETVPSDLSKLSVTDVYEITDQQNTDIFDALLGDTLIKELLKNRPDIKG